jgi:hypothetical protein
MHSEQFRSGAELEPQNVKLLFRDAKRRHEVHPQAVTRGLDAARLSHPPEETG